MKKIKNLNDFTIKEFNDYLEITKNINENSDITDTFSLLELFGIDNPDDLSIDEYKKYMMDINNQVSIKNPKKGVKKYYYINGKKYKSTLNMRKLNAAQFIDLQSFLVENKLEQILSVVLIPMKKTFFGWTDQEYNKNYDILTVQNQILNNFKIGDANELSSFFFQQSTNSLKVTKDYLDKKLVKEKMKKITQEKKQNQKLV